MTPINEYLRRPGTGVLAARLHREDAEEIAVWCNGELQEDGSLQLRTSHGLLRVCVDEFVVQDAEGEFYPCRASVFHTLYRPVVSEA